MNNLPGPLTGNIVIDWQDGPDRDHDLLVSLLEEFGNLLPTALGEHIDIPAYASKLTAHADLAYARHEGRIVGLLALYANDMVARRAYVPLLSILPGQQGKGLGRVMLSRAIARSRQRGMRSVELQVETKNTGAYCFYRACGFRVSGRGDTKSTMIYELDCDTWSGGLTAIERHSRISGKFDLDLDLRIKRDDLYPTSGGGVKARKMEYIMRELIENGNDVIVTNGSLESNHARAAAVVAARLGIRCHLVVVLEPGIKYRESGNLLLMRLSGATIEFCSKDELSRRMDIAMEVYEAQGHRPCYVWGGGHSVAATRALVEGAFEAQLQCGDWRPEFVVLASGTGTTQAGLMIGYAPFPARVIGISVARGVSTGARTISESIDAYGAQYHGETGSLEVDFRDEWTEGGYGRTSSELLETVRDCATAGLFVDTTYSGKALHGLVALARRGEIPRGSNVLFWHTGGLMNLQPAISEGQES